MPDKGTPDLPRWEPPEPAPAPIAGRPTIRILPPRALTPQEAVVSEETSPVWLVELARRCRNDAEREALVATWVRVKGPLDAAGELVALATAGGVADREGAFAALMSIDSPEAEPAVRWALDQPPLRPYAATWLRARGLDATPSTPDSAAWLMADALAAELAEVPEGDDAGVRAVVTAVVDRVGTVNEQVRTVAQLREVSHPAAHAVLAAVRTHHPKRRVARAAGPAPEPVTAYELTITLRDLEPPVWRRLVVPGSLSLGQLHDVIQGAMGWHDEHLHEFVIDGVRYGRPKPAGPFGLGTPVLDEDATRLDRVAAAGTRLAYTYDFGDDWEHDVVVDGVRPAEPGEELPTCLDGRRACPPEDVGGVYGYERALAVLDDPWHPDHEETSEWLGPWDAEAFDVGRTAARLRRIVRPRG